VRKNTAGARSRQSPSFTLCCEECPLGFVCERSRACRCHGGQGGIADARSIMPSFCGRPNRRYGSSRRPAPAAPQRSVAVGAGPGGWRRPHERARAEGTWRGQGGQIQRPFSGSNSWESKCGVITTLARNRLMMTSACLPQPRSRSNRRDNLGVKRVYCINETRTTPLFTGNHGVIIALLHGGARARVLLPPQSEVHPECG
jgi:hypothetical protein